MLYTVKAAARATGVSESRLRTWERRYGVPQPGRAESGRRLYDENDLALIRRMALLVAAGVSAAQAAAGAEFEPPPDAPPQPAKSTRVAKFLAAAQAFDGRALEQVLHESIAALGWALAADSLIFPALQQIGAGWEAARTSVATEHFVSELMRREIAAARHAVPPAADGAARVLLACPAVEQHDLGLSLLALLLQQAGLDTTYLGADLPAEDLLLAIDAIHPDVVCLSATCSAGLASLLRLSRTLATSRRVRLLIGGPAVAAANAETAGILLPATLAPAAAFIVQQLAL